MAGAEKHIPLLLKKLRKETAFISSTTEIMEHPAFESITAWGYQAIPYLLDDLLHKPSWAPLWALEGITEDIQGIDVPEDSLGRLLDITYLWLKWGYKRDYLQINRY